MIKRILQGLLITAFIILLSFLYLAYHYFPKDVWEVFLALDRKSLFLAFFFLLLFHTFDMLRVIVIARSIGLYYPIHYGYLVSLVNTFGATVTPAHLGGEFLPLYTLARKGGEVYKIATVVTLKGLSGLLFYLLFLPFTLKVLFSSPKLAKELLAIVLAILFLSLILYFAYLFLKERRGIVKKEKELISSFKRSFRRYVATCRRFYREHKVVFLLSVLLSIALYLSFLAIGAALLKAFNPSVSIAEVFIDQLPLLYAIFMSPTPGGSGVGEFGAIPVFSQYLPEEYLGLFIILWRGLSQYLSALIGGIIFLVFLLRDVAKYNQRR
jgi:uncharacterized protein (TIRG00374 family)